MTAQEARTHIRYSGWASRKVLEAALALPPEDLAEPMGVSHESVAKTLTHIYFADAIWYSRIADSSYPVPSHDALPSLEFVIEEWPRLQAKWEAWSDTASDDDVARQVPFKSRFVGNAGLPAWQIVMHVVNHATSTAAKSSPCYGSLAPRRPQRTSSFTTSNKRRLPRARAFAAQRLLAKCVPTTEGYLADDDARS